MTSPAQLRDAALAAEKAGDQERARKIWQQAATAFPHDAALLNSAGAAHLRWNEPDKAADLFETARAIAPDQIDYAINAAIALGRMGRNEAARKVLEKAETAGRGMARYWSARGHAERSCHALASAQASYDAALALEPRHPRAMHGRARIALERSQDDAVTRFDRALAQTPDDPQLWLGKAMALDAAGRADTAIEILEQVATRAPHWTEGLKALAQLRLAAGDPAFADHFEKAVSASSPPDEVFAAWARTLASMDLFEEAAAIAGRARREARSEDQFALLEAVFAGMAGDLDRAEEIFAAHGNAAGEWKAHRARHDIRMGRIAAAERALGEFITAGNGSVNLWALRDVCWRLADDPRHEWLHGQEGLVRAMTLDREEVLEDARHLLRDLHAQSALPIGQSVRGGTQTRGRLFDREEDVLARLRDAIMETLERYRAQLPPPDPTHPALRHRGDAWRITHSWSVRLVSAGFHTSHIHPLGVLSSALYLAVPDSVHEPGEPGHLEIGRPPPDLRTGLEPLATILPQPGRLILFPSTLYHGTHPFEGGERLTVAFDVSAGGVP